MASHFYENMVAQGSKDKDEKEIAPSPLVVFIGGIPSGAQEASLKMFLERSFGPVDKVKIILDKETKKSKGYGFVRFFEECHAQMLKDQGLVTFMNKNLNVGDAFKGERTNPSPRKDSKKVPNLNQPALPVGAEALAQYYMNPLMYYSTIYGYGYPNAYMPGYPSMAQYQQYYAAALAAQQQPSLVANWDTTPLQNVATTGTAPYTPINFAGAGARPTTKPFQSKSRGSQPRGLANPFPLAPVSASATTSAPRPHATASPVSSLVDVEQEISQAMKDTMASE